MLSWIKSTFVLLQIITNSHDSRAEYPNQKNTSVLEKWYDVTDIQDQKLKPPNPNMIQHCFNIIDLKSNVSGGSPKHEKGQNPETFEWNNTDDS